MTVPVLLELDNLTTIFPTRRGIVRAVGGVSFKLHKKEKLGIVGESGSGKSVTLRSILRLVPYPGEIIDGTVYFQGEALSSKSPRQMRELRGKDIAVIFQDPMTSLNPTMKIGDQIIEGHLLHHASASRREAREYAVHLLELVGIPQASSRVDEYAHTLSGGMRQRAMIALALAPKPKLIIADEPTTALDVTIQAQILDLMKQIKDKTGTSFILITHDMSVVAGYCDRVLVMYSGKVIEKAPVDTLFERPSHPYTQGLLQSIPRLDMPAHHPLLPIQGSPPSLTEEIKGCAFCNRCEHAMPICKEKDPSLEEHGSSHFYACWRSDESSR